MSLAQAKVFSLPEIVENILLWLPLEDLLVNTPLVCQAWNKLTKGPALQQALFFQSIPRSADQTPRFNPLLREVFRPWFEKKRDLHGRGEEFRTLHWNRSPRQRAAYSRREASWRRMLPVQPPAVIFQVSAIIHSMMGPRGRVGRLQFEDGVRMGTLYDLAQKTVARPISLFRVQWNMVPAFEDGGGTPLQQEVAFEPSPKVTMHTEHISQCESDLPDDVGPGFRSEAYQELEIVFEDA
jgi:hypothetical protein